jgi:hypothetical protein
MKTSLRNRRIQLAAIITILALSAVAFQRLAVAAKWKAGAIPVAASPAVTTLPNEALSRVPLKPQAGEVEAELLTVRPYGFEPSQIIRPGGQFLLAIDNRSQLGELSLQLDRVGGARLKQVQLRKGRPDDTSLLDLPPGQYLLTEADHPEWACKITITPQ